MRALYYAIAAPTDPGGEARQHRAQEYGFVTYCRKYGHTPVATFIETASDASASAYQRMVEHIRASGLAYLVVLARATDLGTDPEEAVGRLLELDSLQCKTVCTDESVPDPLQGIVRAWVASSPGAQRREHIVKAMQTKALRAEGLGRPPYGFRISKEGRLEQVPEETEVVRLIFRLNLEEGLGIRSIARHLNEHGHATRRGQSWSMVTIRDILRNSVYMGTYSRFGMRIPHSHQRIVSPEEFRRAQDQMQQRRPARRNARPTPFLLSGLLYCGECGSRMMGVTRRQGWRRKGGERVRRDYRYYQCQSRTNRSQCQYHTWQAAELDERVLALLRDGPGGDGVAPEAPPQPAVESIAQERARHEARLRALRRRYLEQVRQAATGAISLARLREVTASIETDRRACRARLAALEAKAASPNEARQEALRRLREEWGTLSLEDRQVLLNTLLARVTVTGDRRVELSFHA